MYAKTSPCVFGPKSAVRLHWARSRVASILIPLAVLWLSATARAQMVTGTEMEGFDEALGLRGGGVTIRQLECSLGPNVLWPGDEAAFTFHVKADGGYRGELKVDVVRYGTRGQPGDMWRPVVFRIAEVSSSSQPVELSPDGGVVQVTPRIGEAYGGYALIVDLGGRGRFFGATCVRVPAAEPGRVWLPTYALDLPWPFEMSREVYRLFERLGVKGARVEGGYDTIDEAHVDWALESDLTLMLTVGCGRTPREQQPLGRGRPWLRDNDETIEGVKEDLAWVPSFDEAFQSYLESVLCKHGWPKGPINAVELWNEPWEGVSISGWGADMLRYRELYTRMARAVLAARERAGVKVLVGGACSSSNTRDKLFCDGRDTFLPWLDFVSIHYQPLAADPILVPEWRNRKGEYGPVRVWDTESWVANSEDRVAAVIASMRAMGQDRTAGIYRGNVYTPEKHRLDGKEHSVVQVWSPGAAVAACQQFIGQRAFREILFKNGLPWVFVFDGLPRREGVERRGPSDPDDGTLVVVGDLGASYERNRVLFRSVVIRENAALELSDGEGKFVLYDFYGNPLPSRDHRIVVPIHGLGYFLRTDGSPGSFEALCAAVASATIRGVDPVEIIAHDMIAPIANEPELRVRLTNVFNREVQGSLSVRVEGLEIEPVEQEIRLAGNETRELRFRILGGNAAEDNAYRLTARFDGDADGTVTHVERMHVNFVAKRKIQVDGKLDDWSGVVPQRHAQTVGASSTEKAYLPFKSWEERGGSGSVTARLAYDEEFFYFAAEVPRIEGMVRFETRDDDSYFYPESVTSKGVKQHWPEGVRRFSYRRDPDLPSGNGRHNVQIAFNVIPSAEKPLDSHPPGTMPRFCAYMDTDYEFALNKVDDPYGGGTEIFCLTRPGAPRKHFYPRQPGAPIDGGPVKGGSKLAIVGNVVECALSWDVIPEVRARLDAGETIRFSFRVNDGGRAFELAAGRSVSKDNPFAFHNDWSTHWANELEFGFER